MMANDGTDHGKAVNAFGHNPLKSQGFVAERCRPMGFDERVGDRTRTGDSQIHNLEL